MTKPKLEPCPFCGYDDVGLTHTRNGLYCFIKCHSCQAESGHWCDPTFPIEAWNKRATHPPELSGNTGELKQTKEDLSDDFIEADRYARSLFKQIAPECELLDSPSGVITQIDNAIAGYKSQLEDYRKAMEWLASKQFDLSNSWDDKFVLRVAGFKEWIFDKSPLSAIQNAMAKEGEAK